MMAAYRASGGQVDANGIPNGKGYVAPILSPTQVKQENDAARRAQQQATAALKAAAKAAAKTTGNVVTLPPDSLTNGAAATLGGIIKGGILDPLDGLLNYVMDQGQKPSFQFNLSGDFSSWWDKEFDLNTPVDQIYMNATGKVAQASSLLIPGIDGAEAAEVAADAGDLAKAGDLGDDLSGLGDSCLTGNKSFTADTGVLLASGAAVPISRLEVGDKVLATSTKSGKTQPEAVTAVLVHPDTDLYDLKIKADGRTEVIHTTADHLFWDPSLDYGQIPAKHLKPGEYLKTPDGTLATVGGGTTPKVHEGWMWDLTVPGNNDHDFYVLPAVGSQASTQGQVYPATGEPVLVHNDSCRTLLRPPGQRRRMRRRMRR